MRLYRLIAFLWMLTAGCPCGAQQRDAISARAMEALLDPRPIEQTAMHFDTTEATIPPLSEEDAPVTVAFRFTNTGKAPLVITRVAASCGCIVAAYHKAPILTGKDGVIRITFSPAGHPGKLLRKIFIYTNLAEQAPTARLTLLGEVASSKDPWRSYPHTLGELRTRQREVTIRSDRKTKVVECLACVNAGQRPLHPKTSETCASYIQLRTIPETLKPGEEGDLVVTLDTAHMPADLPDTVRIPLQLEGLGTSSEQSTLLLTIINR